jgi:hypothetical protein
MKQKNNIVDSKILANLEFHTKLSEDQRKSYVNWFNRQNIEFQILIFDEQRNQFFKLKNSNAKQDILPLAAFYLAIKHFYVKEQLLKSKNKTQSLNELGNLSKIERVKFKKQKPKPKLQMLLSMNAIIEQLHGDGYSSREIKLYLQNKYRKTISHTYLANYIREHIVHKGAEDV